MNDYPGPDKAAEKHPLLLEIGIEEIPSDVLPKALKQLGEISRRCFEDAALPFGTLEVYGTPRRIVLYLPHLASRQASKTEVTIGPPKQAAFDAAGKPTSAAAGFAKSQGVQLSEIQIQDTGTLGSAAKAKKGEYLVIKKERGGAPTKTLLKTLIPETIARLTFPRSMRWNESGVAFVRPIRSILAIYDGKVVPFSYAGVSAGNLSCGHHIMAPESFVVEDFDSYREGLRLRFVLIDPGERLGRIKTEIEALAKEKQGRLEADESLLLQAAHTVEYPKALCGNFDPDFLAIPKEIITTAMAEHQGYFPLYRKDGALLPHFITILNVDSKDLTLIQTGNERVLRARLHDARFYFEQDRKQRLSTRVEDLKQLMFQEKLGSVYEKVERLKTLSASIANTIGCADEDKQDLKRAAHLCKADLVTGVVREFTSLQGTMGRVYASKEGENDFVARAIEEHYLPRHAGDRLPVVRSVGEILAIADKLDTIVGCFGAGLIPTGSEDPYALRRQGLGIIQMLVNRKSYKVQKLSLKDVVKKAIECYGDKFYVPDLSGKIISFFKLRIDSYLQQSRGIRYDLRDAVLARDLDKPLVIVECAEALSTFSKQPVFQSLITVYKRVARILPPGFVGQIREDTFVHQSEKDLHKKYVDVHKAILHLWVTKSYLQVLERLSTLNDPLNRFFDDVLVMHENKAIRQNRLSLLYDVSRPFKEFGDFSKIVEEQTPT
ncbi:MAG: glycine--tRNA ligase subunit beta [Nitrospiria bacterium]